MKNERTPLPAADGKEPDLERGVLPAWIKRSIDNGDVSISLHFEFSVDGNDWNSRNIGCDYLVKIFADILTRGGGEEEVEIGWITGYQSKNSDLDVVFLWADSIGQVSSDAFGWLITCEKFKVEKYLSKPIVYVHAIYINPEWRGHSFGLYALGTLYDSLDAGFAFLHPATLADDNTSEFQDKTAAKKIRNYWKKLGLDNYDQGYAFSLNWDCPEEYAGKPDF